MGALTGLRILDLSRVLAGPTATQILGDLGADVIKIERPGVGDDTRSWGPPFLKREDGSDSSESSYYLCANRNKRSLAIDLKHIDGQKLIQKLIPHCDVLVENFKAGGLEKYGLSYDQLKFSHPRLVYCSITGFGQTGPLSSEPGYDFLAQGMAGFMAITGAIGGGPTKAGVAIADYVTGLYAVIGILSALRARDQTGLGQQVDLSLLDSSVAMMSNVAQYFLTSGEVSPRVGNAHKTIVPYQEFETSDSHVIVAVGNDQQFRVFADILGHSEWANDVRFRTNAARVVYRDDLLKVLIPLMKERSTIEWVNSLRAVDIPVGPILEMDQVFNEPQIQNREMKINMNHPVSNIPVSLVGSPLKLTKTPVTYRFAPPIVGADTVSVLQEILKMTTEEIMVLRNNGVIG